MNLIFMKESAEFFFFFPSVFCEFHTVTGRFRQRRVELKSDRIHFVFITSSHRIFRWTWTQFPHTAWFHGGSLEPSSSSPVLPLPPSAPCLSLWSCLPWLSASPVWPSATSLPSLPPPLPRSHSSLLGWGAPGDGPRRLAIQNANQALGGTSHDFPPRHELLFCYWFHYNQTVPVTFLLSGGRSAALTAAEGLPVIWPFSHSLRIYVLSS